MIQNREYLSKVFANDLKDCLQNLNKKFLNFLSFHKLFLAFLDYVWPSNLNFKKFLIICMESIIRPSNYLVLYDEIQIIYGQGGENVNSFLL